MLICGHRKRKATRFRRTSGLLLHPAIGYMMDEAVEIQEHKIRFATVDLSAHTDVICEQLLRLIPE